MVYKRIAQYLSDHGIKQSVLAARSGMTKQALSDALRGVRKLQADEYVAICDALEVSTDTFASNPGVDEQ